MAPNAHLKVYHQKVQFSIYARFDGNHIQNVDFVKLILQEATVRNKNNVKKRKQDAIVSIVYKV